MGNSLDLDNFKGKPLTPRWAIESNMESEWKQLKNLESEIRKKIESSPNRKDLGARQITISKKDLAQAIDICPTNLSKNLERYQDLLIECDAANKRLKEFWSVDPAQKRVKSSSKLNKSELAADNKRLEKEVHRANKSKISDLLQDELRHGNIDLVRKENIARRENRELKEKNEKLHDLNETLMRQSTDMINERTGLLSQISILRSEIEKLKRDRHGR
jgi:hypothetical protein